VLGSTVSIVGRNYGSRQMVAVQAVAVVVPIGAGLMLKSDIYYFMLGLCLALHLRPHYNGPSTCARCCSTPNAGAQVLADRAALRPRAQYDGAWSRHARRRWTVVVANAEAPRALGFPGVDKMLGRNLRSLFARAVAAGLLTPKDMAFLSSQLVNRWADA
jgi:hypothetical protein